MPTTPWTRDHLAALTDDPATHTPVIPDAGIPHLLDGVDFWDLWPVRTPDGGVAALCGREVWAALSAPASGHPGERHDQARIWTVARTDDGWEDLGPLFPAGTSAGSREWAGSLVHDPDAGTLMAFYTAAGRRGDTSRSFEQRIFTTTAPVACADGTPRWGEWSHHVEAVVADGARYQKVDQLDGEPGFIKAFRDPSPFRDPRTGRTYLLFTASLVGSATDFDGVIGVAERVDDAWELREPLLTADGVNNELERPHLVPYEGRYLLFFSTQRRTFHPDVSGPTGLYAFVGDDVLGPYEPLNGSGLVLQNPPSEPFQAYSWLVLPDLRASGFVDSFALHGRHPDDLESQGVDVVRAQFGGTRGPVSQLRVEGLRAWVEPAT